MKVSLSSRSLQKSLSILIVSKVTKLKNNQVTLLLANTIQRQFIMPNFQPWRSELIFSLYNSSHDHEYLTQLELHLELRTNLCDDKILVHIILSAVTIKFHARHRLRSLTSFLSAKRQVKNGLGTTL